MHLMRNDIGQGESRRQLGTHDPGGPVVRVALPQDAEAVYDLVQDGITATYPACYEPAVVHAFSSYHTREYVASDIALGKVRVLEADGSILATATLDGEYITRVYVATDMRGHGLGSLIMDALEAEAAIQSGRVFVEASATAESFYLGRGYALSHCENWHVEAADGFPAVTIVYKVLEKPVRRDV